MKQPTNTQTASARPVLEANRQLKEKSGNSVYNFTKKHIEKHKSEKALADFPQTVGLLTKHRVGRVDRMKKWLVAHDRR